MVFDPNDQDRIRRVFDAIVEDVPAGATANAVRAGAGSGRRRSPVGVMAAAAGVTAAVAIGVVLLTTGGPSDVGAPSVTTTPTSTTTISPTTSTTGSSTTAAQDTTTVPPLATTTVATGCTSGSPTIPAGATSAPVGDVDGDGRPDTAWVVVGSDGVVRVGIVTAAGGGAARVWDSASPVSRTILVADADASLPVEIFADDGRLVQLWQFSHCEIRDVVDAGGRPYVFSLGFGQVGTGVGCVDIAGRRQLVGLDIASDDGTTVAWSRTIVHLGDGTAANGAISTGTFSRPGDAQAIDLLRTVSCGDLTMAADGITAATP